MNLSRLARALALLAVVVVTAWLFSPRPDPPPVPVAPPSPPATYAGQPLAPTGPPATPTALLPSAPSTRPASPRPPTAPGPVVSAAPPATAGATPPPSALSPVAATAVAVDQVRLMLRDYRTLTGENPVGTNAEILRTLMGDNPRQARLGPPEGQTLNADGELVDRWGTPLFFHQLSGTVTEIRSAGPDKILWTDDDIVTR